MSLKNVVIRLKKKLIQRNRIIGEMQEELDFYKSCHASFWTGDIPNNSSMDHQIMAQWGRKRLEARKQSCALLVKK